MKEEIKEQFKKALSTAGDLRIDDADGGYLPKPVADEIVKYISEINWCRKIFRTIIMKKKTLDVPVITSGRSTYGEGVYYVPSQVDITDKSTQVGPKLHSVRLTAKKLMAFANVDQDDVEDAITDVIDILMESFAEAFAEAEEYAFMLGDTTTETADSPLKAWNGLIKLAEDASLTVDHAVSTTNAQITGVEEAISLGIKKLGKFGRSRGNLVGFVCSDIAEALRRSKRLITIDNLGIRSDIGPSGEEVAKLYGVKLYESAYITGSQSGKTGCAVICPKGEPLIGDRRKIKIVKKDLPEHDKTRYIISERLDFNVRHRAYNSGVAGNAEAVVLVTLTGSLS